MNTSSSLHATLYRIGAVSKLSGIPVPTLRVWQTRYGAFAPITTLGQHRLYNDDDVQKAYLLKSLTSQGHGISQIAPLTTLQLAQLLQTGAAFAAARAQTTAPQPQAPAAWAVVGASLAQRLHASTLNAKEGWAALPIEHVWADLAVASSAPQDKALAVLMVSINSLTDEVAEQILAVSRQHGAQKTVVLYGFGQMGALACLRRAGHAVHRDPLNDKALLDIILSARQSHPVAAWVLNKLPNPIPARQFSDGVLQRVANIPSQVLCECPRHVAELIGQLGRFEDYSRDCLNQSAKDAELHTQLNIVAATARALFENALQMVAAHEGISLREEN